MNQLTSVRRTLLDLGWRVYRQLWPHLPDRRQTLAGVPTTQYGKVGDNWMPGSWPIPNRTRPRYECALAQALRQCVRPGDTVVNVGGGVGIIAIIAARLAGPSGKVICYEGSGDQFEKIKANLALNGVQNVDLHNRIVARPVFVYGDAARHAASIEPTELPPCDVLELDCEGSEIEILETMLLQPRAIIVETHGLFGAPTARVAALLAARGYDVIDLGPAEPDIARSCIDNDIHVLLARAIEPQPTA
jgi:hypothetical protein